MCPPRRYPACRHLGRSSNLSPMDSQLWINAGPIRSAARTYLSLRLFGPVQQNIGRVTMDARTDVSTVNSGLNVWVGVA